MISLSRRLATVALSATVLAVSTAHAQPRAIASYVAAGSISSTAGGGTPSNGWSFRVEQTITVNALGALFSSAVPSQATQQVGLFAGTTNTLLYSAIVAPDALITRPAPSGSADYEYHYVLVNPFQLLAGNVYTLLSAAMPGTQANDYTTLQFINTMVLDSRLTFQQFAEGDDANLTANDGVGFTTLQLFADTPGNSYRASAGPDFLIQRGVTATPEPATIALTATGLLAIGGLARRRRGTNA